MATNKNNSKDIAPYASAPQQPASKPKDTSQPIQAKGINNEIGNFNQTDSF